MTDRFDRSHLEPPPPPGEASPRYLNIPEGERLLRLFDPSSHRKPSELTFRSFGPLERFDHHRPDSNLSACPDGERGVWYSSNDDLACALVEIFGDERMVFLSPWRMARPATTRPLRLLDLRGPGAMAAGTVAEIAKSGDAISTWEWARYFYEQSDVYGEVDGLAWLGAHNDGECVLLFERAETSLSCDDCSLPLSDPRLRDTVLRVVLDHAMKLAMRPV